MPGINQVLTPAQAHKLKNICDVAVPLLSTDWQGTAAPYTIQVDWPGMTDRDMPEVWLVPAGDTPSDEELAAARLITPSTEDGHMLFSATSKPTTSITARVTGIAVSGEFNAGNMASLVAKVDQLNRGLSGISNPNLVLLLDIAPITESTVYTVDWVGYDEVLLVAVMHYSSETNFAHLTRRVSKNEWAMISGFDKICDGISPAMPFILTGDGNSFANLGVFFRSPTTFSLRCAGALYGAVGLKVYTVIK